MGDYTEQAEELLNAAEGLNKISDSLGNEIKKLEKALQRFNLGVEAWTEKHDDFSLGYAKVNGKWQVAISTEKEIWGYCESPRRYRVSAVQYLPELFEALNKAAGELEARIGQAIETAKVIVDNFK